MNFLIGKVFDEHYRKEIVKIESARWVHGFFGWSGRWDKWQECDVASTPPPPPLAADLGRGPINLHNPTDCCCVWHERAAASFSLGWEASLKISWESFARSFFRIGRSLRNLSLGRTKRFLVLFWFTSKSPGIKILKKWIYQSVFHHQNYWKKDNSLPSTMKIFILHCPNILILSLYHSWIRRWAFLSVFSSIKSRWTKARRGNVRLQKWKWGKRTIKDDVWGKRQFFEAWVTCLGGGS